MIAAVVLNVVFAVFVVVGIVGLLGWGIIKDKAMAPSLAPARRRQARAPKAAPRRRAIGQASGLTA